MPNVSVTRGLLEVHRTNDGKNVFLSVVAPKYINVSTNLALRVLLKTIRYVWPSNEKPTSNYIHSI